MQMNDKWGFIDKAGATILPFRYDTVTSFNAGMCAVLTWQMGLYPPGRFRRAARAVGKDR